MATCMESVTSTFNPVINFATTNARSALDFVVEGSKSLASRVSLAAGPALTALVAFASANQIAFGATIAVVAGVTLLVARLWNSWNPPTVADFSVQAIGEGKSRAELLSAAWIAELREAKEAVLQAPEDEGLKARVAKAEKAVAQIK